MTSGSSPQLSLVIAAYNDWVALEKCLASVAGQRNAPEIEVLVIDDGSAAPAPAPITGRNGYFDVRVVRQSHSGIEHAGADAAARTPAAGPGPISEDEAGAGLANLSASYPGGLTALLNLFDTGECAGVESYDSASAQCHQRRHGRLGL